MSAPRNLIIYLMRRDLRVADNPILHEISKLSRQSHQPFTHLLPLYIFPVHQIEVSGFLSSPAVASPYPHARSQVGGFWRCGHHRALFLAEAIWDVKSGLEDLGSSLEIRVGRAGEVMRGIVDSIRAGGGDVVGIWMTEEEGVEEKREESEVRQAAAKAGVDFRLWLDEKYFIDDRDIPFDHSRELPDVFTSYRKMVEPLREAPRRTLPRPTSLPPLPSQDAIPLQASPFSIPSSLNGIIDALHRPLETDMGLKNPPGMPDGVESAHPFHGGETTGHRRIQHLISSGSMSRYKDTRNGLLGQDFSTKLSAWLALGCITARQIHEYLLAFEDGTNSLGKGVPGFGKGESKGTAAVRFELLWRDYMRLCTRKFGHRLFRVEGFRNDKSVQWKYLDRDAETRVKLERFLEGRTGTGLIDASMRELFLTGYTSNRARQNVASFIAKHLGIDWRLGAEWYETMLIDYDVSSNWGNWQYTAGVGNDPRGEARVFNPVKQAFDYDPTGAYIQAWVPELRLPLEPQSIFQAWKVPQDLKAELGLADLEWVRSPLKRIEYRPSAGKSGHLNKRGAVAPWTKAVRRDNGKRNEGGRSKGKGRKGLMDRVEGGIHDLSLND